MQQTPATGVMLFHWSSFSSASPWQIIAWRVFTSLKLIETDRRNQLGEDRLDHLVHIAVDGPPFHQWDATEAVQLWWKSSTQRRQVQDARAAPTHRTSQGEDSGTDIYSFNLEDWDTFIA